MIRMIDILSTLNNAVLGLYVQTKRYKRVDAEGLVSIPKGFELADDEDEIPFELIELDNKNAEPIPSADLPAAETPALADSSSDFRAPESPDSTSVNNWSSLSEFHKEHPIGDGFTSLDELCLSVRSYNCLKRHGIDSVEELRGMTEDELCSVRNLGRKQLEEIIHVVFESPLGLKGEDVFAGGLAELDQLIGLENVKNQVRKITAFARMQQSLMAAGQEKIPIVLNMEFVGNPGTAKTTVARILAHIFHETGLLSSASILEVGRADLVARYEGQTADRVKDIFRRAKGRLLFIDEAYSLVEEADGGGFGAEAIHTIVQEMENHRDETIVIFAGYPDQMESFFDTNPGLRSRVPFKISFDDYSAAELTEIAALEAGKRGFTISPDAVPALLDICGEACGQGSSGNGRFARNLVEDAILQYALRTFGADGVSDTAAMGMPALQLTGADFQRPQVSKAPVVKQTLGFAMPVR